MSNDSDVPFPAIDGCPPPLYDDIFATDEEPDHTSHAGDSWDGEVDPHLFTSSNLFSAEDLPSSAEQQEATPGGLIFPDLPVLGERDEIPDLFGSQHQAIPGNAASASSKETSPVS